MQASICRRSAASPLPFVAAAPDNRQMADALVETNPDLQRRLTAAARRTGDAAFLHERCADELMSRLELLDVAPETIVDAGAGNATLARRLAARYRRADVLAVEHCRPLSAAGSDRGPARWLRRRRRIERIAAPLDALPFDDDAIDLVASVLALPRYAPPDPALSEIARVLAPGGAFSFVTLGPDTLDALREAWRQVDDGVHVADFTDMHDIGDALGRAGFTEPVLDVETLELSYGDVATLWRDLTAFGARNCLPGRRRGLTGRRRFAAMRRALDGGEGFALHVELVFGQCWGLPAARRRGEVSIAPDAIGRRRRGGPSG